MATEKNIIKLDARRLANGLMEVSCECSEDVGSLTNVLFRLVSGDADFAMAAHNAVLIFAAASGQLDELVKLINENREALMIQAEDLMNNRVVVPHSGTEGCMS